ncbi:MAG: flagellar basal body rod protein FlgB [Dissulfurispiraceae bacterium]
MPDSIHMILEHMLDVAAFRNKVLTSNIANADTPGYKAKDISFQKEMEKAAGTEGNQGFDIYESATTMPNRDGNTVNVDIEMAKVAENNLIYDTAVQLMGMKQRMKKNILSAP